MKNLLSSLTLIVLIVIGINAHAANDSTANGIVKGDSAQMSVNTTDSVADFSAARSNGAVILSWVIQQEQHLSAFVIEKSTDGVKWQASAVVAAHPANSAGASVYFYGDAHARTINYYRLKMQSGLSQVNYSAAIKIEASNNGNK